MKRKQNNQLVGRVKQIMTGAGLSLLLATLPLHENSWAQSAAPTTNAAPASSSSVAAAPNTSCSFASPDFADQACAAGMIVLIAPVAVAGAAVAAPMLLMWCGLGLAIEPFVPAGGRNPLD